MNPRSADITLPVCGNNATVRCASVGLRPALPCWCSPHHAYHRSPLALTVSLRALGGWRQTARLTKHTFKPTHASLFQPSRVQSYFLPPRKRNEESRKWLKELECQSAQWGKLDVDYIHRAAGRGHEVKWELGDGDPSSFLAIPLFSGNLHAPGNGETRFGGFDLPVGSRGAFDPLLDSSCVCSQGLVFLDLPLKRKMTFICDEELQSSDQMSPLPKLSQYALTTVLFP